MDRDGNSNDGSGDERLHFELGDDLLLPAHLRSRAMSNHQIRNLSQTLYAEVQRPTGGIEAAASIQHPCNVTFDFMLTLKHFKNTKYSKSTN